MVSVNEIGTPRGSKSSRSKYLSSQRGQVYDDEVATSLPDCISVYSPDGSERPTSVRTELGPYTTDGEVAALSCLLIKQRELIFANKSAADRNLA